MRSLLFIIGSSLLLHSTNAMIRTHLMNYASRKCLSVWGSYQQVIVKDCSDSETAQFWNEIAIPGIGAMWQNDATKTCLGLRTNDLKRWFPQMLPCSPSTFYTNWKISSYHDASVHPGLFLLENYGLRITYPWGRQCLYFNGDGRFETTSTCGQYIDQWWYSGSNGQTKKPASASIDTVAPPEYVIWLFGLIVALLLINICCMGYYQCHKSSKYDKVDYGSN